MSYWVLILWITFTPADGGGMITAEVSFDPGNRAVCEEQLRNFQKDLILHGFGKEGNRYYPSKVEGKCETRKYKWKN